MFAAEIPFIFLHISKWHVRLLKSDISSIAVKFKRFERLPDVNHPLYRLGFALI